MEIIYFPQEVLGRAQHIDSTGVYLCYYSVRSFSALWCTHRISPASSKFSKERLTVTELRDKEAVRRSRRSFFVSSLVSITKIFRKKKFVCSFGFYKSQRKWGRRSARESNGNENCRFGNECSCNGSVCYLLVYVISIS